MCPRLPAPKSSRSSCEPCARYRRVCVCVYVCVSLCSCCPATSQFHNKMNVTYLPVYYPSEEEQADPKLYAHNVRQVMVRKTTHT